MLSRSRIILLFGLPCLLFGLAADAAAQAGRLGGNVVYFYGPGTKPEPARNARVFALGSYAQYETRTNNDGIFVMVLPAGDYRIAAVGASGFEQAQEVKGYVRVNTDSVITPNPLFLVRSNRRSSSVTTTPTSSREVSWGEILAVTYLKSFLLETTLQNGSTGRLQGKVMRRDTGGPAKHLRVFIYPQGPLRQSQCRTDANGTFVSEPLPEGEYKIVVAANDKLKNGEASGRVIAGKTSNVAPDPIWLEK